jgi:Na+/H+-dicarboxylate symporter
MSLRHCLPPLWKNIRVFPYSASGHHRSNDDWVKAQGDAFIKRIKMVIPPVVFCMVVSGISHVDDLRRVDRAWAQRQCSISR